MVSGIWQTNVHGTDVEVDSVIDERTVRVGLKHFEQLGFEFAGEGDEVWFVHQPSSERALVNQVLSVEVINDRNRRQ